MLTVDESFEDIKIAELYRFAARVQRLLELRGQVDVLITSSRRLQDLNRRFRKKNKPTDVLSFPRGDENGGDIAISAGIADDNAARYGHELQDELKVLILHGMLHLAGYDHERDNGEMAAKEQTLRERLGLPTALIERTKGLPRRARRRAEAKGQRPIAKGQKLGAGS